ncbi:TraR/DksA family transcriptional regulator [Jonesia quinghaiensis]|uniref:TraR/DksA family transcriptional regulator n=1 Tax=Jonesia quinghaiensis TaxID=262806 RepID=UPI00048F947E|nr:TraR/DksA C4-type zinc finger protein [Jonesia quinghaiensis]
MGSGNTTGADVTQRFSHLDASSVPVRPGEEPWAPAELMAVAQALLDEDARLRQEIEAAHADLTEFLRNSGEGSGDDQADYGSSALEREQELTLVNNTRDLLEQNQRAISRLDAGTYGVCETCGEPVGKARLEAFPRATLCVACKQREERR